LDELPDGFFRDVLTGHVTASIDGSEHVAACQACGGLPNLYRHLHPSRHGDRSDSTAFPGKVNDAPSALALLNLLES
jgi:hypothetical protein